MKITQREKQTCYEAVGFMPFSKRVMKILGTDWECIDMELDIAVYLIANENAIPLTLQFLIELSTLSSESTRIFILIIQ